MGHFKPNNAEVAKLLGPTGPFGRELERFGREVRDSAKRKALVGYNAPRRETPNTGVLRDSIRASRVTHTAKGLEVTISAYRRRGPADVAYIIHQGHQAIVPKDKALKFWVRQGQGLRGRDRFITIEPHREGPTRADESRVGAGLAPHGKGYVRAVGGHPFLTRALEEEAAADSIRSIVAQGGGVRYIVLVRRPDVQAAPPRRSHIYINR